jgi:hypothetical protein
MYTVIAMHYANWPDKVLFGHTYSKSALLLTFSLSPLKSGNSSYAINNAQINIF